MRTKVMMIAAKLFFIISIPFSLISQNFELRNLEAGRIGNIENTGRVTPTFLRNADINYQSFDLENAYFAYENAVAQRPNSPDALLRRATFKKRIGMETEAAIDFRLANRLNPYAADLYGYNGLYSIVNVMAFEPEEALSELSWPVKILQYHEMMHQYFLDESTNLEEWNLVEEVLFEAEEEHFETTYVLLDSLLYTFPNSAMGFDLKGLLFHRTGDYKQAKEAFSIAVSLDPNYAISWYNLGQVERIEGNFEAAKEYLDRAIELEPNLMKGYFDRALVLKAMGQKEEALKEYDRMVEVKNVYVPEVFLNRGLTKKMLGDFDGALADLDAAIKADQSNPILYKNRANLYMLLGHHQHAVEDYSSALQLDDELVEAYYNRALAHFLLYNNTSACEDLSKSIEMGYDRAEDIRTYFCIE